MSLPRYTVPETETTEAEISRWQAELDRDMRAVDRTPVAVIPGAYSLPLAVCKDGSVWQLQSVPLDPQEGDGRLFSWDEMPPLPGSARDVSGDYWRTPNATASGSLVARDRELLEQSYRALRGLWFGDFPQDPFEPEIEELLDLIAEGLAEKPAVARMPDRPL